MSRFRNATAAVTAAAAFAVPGSALAASTPAPLSWLKAAATGPLVADSGPLLAQTTSAPDGSTLAVYADSPAAAPTDGSGYRRLRMFRALPNGRVTASTIVSNGAGDASDSQVVQMANGSGAIVYLEKSGSGGNRVVKLRRFDAAFRLQGGPVVLSDAAKDAEAPSMGLAPDGTATIGWTYPAAVAAAIVRVSPAGDSMPYSSCSATAPEITAGATLTACSGMQVVTAPSGASTVLWREGITAPAQNYSRIVKRWISPGDISLPEARDEISVSPGFQVGNPVLKLGSDGAALAVWRINRPQTLCANAPSACPDNRFEARRLPANGDKGTRTALTETTSTFGVVDRSAPVIAADSKGGYLVTWVDSPSVRGPTGSSVKYRRVSKTGTPTGTAKTVAYSPTSVSAAIVASTALFTGSNAQLLWLTDTKQLNYVTVPRSDLVGRGALVPGSAATAAVAPALALSADGTFSATWFGGARGAARIRTQMVVTKPTASSVKFLASVKGGAKSAKLSFKASKLGSARVLIAPTSPKLKVAKRLTKVRSVKPGTNAVSFDTRGIKRGIYRVTVTFTDLAGLSTTTSAKLIVTR